MSQESWASSFLKYGFVQKTGSKSMNVK